MLIPVAEQANPGAPYLGAARRARAALLDWNQGIGIDDDVSPPRSPAERGISDPEAFFGTRHSVRDYKTLPAPGELLTRAVELAINTPSVCNRQSWHVRFYSDPADVTSVLQFQNGNVGMRPVPTVALVTVDTQLFGGIGERNQGWIEGGLFSMSLVWAMHSLGLDTCMLNMSARNETTDRLRKHLDIDDGELVIMMIAVGYGRDGHRRARSVRRSTDEVLRTAVSRE